MLLNDFGKESWTLGLFYILFFHGEVIPNAVRMEVDGAW
jgi:hypothetical protein